MLTSVGTPWMWGGFTLFILVMLVLDLAVFHRKAHTVSIREAFALSVFWVGLALLFNLGVYHEFGRHTAMEFLAGYLIEKALSVDNIFVFLVIFSYFNVPSKYRHRMLIWGVLGAIVLRVIFILAGAALLARFHWVTYVFGGFLIYTGIRLLSHGEETVDPGKNPMLRLFRRILPVTDDYHGFRLVTRHGGRLMATPLLLVLLTIEGSDLLFAVDSIPAVFAVTRDPFIVFTSNIFAILGLRALFFLLAGIIDQFRYLKYGLGLVLSFVGVKMLLVAVGVKVPIGLSLSVIAGLLFGSVVLSVLRPAPGASAVGAGGVVEPPDNGSPPEPIRS